MIGRSHRTVLRRRRVIGLGALLVSVLAGAMWVALDRRQAVPDGPTRVADETPYLNARPGVAFVGDEACARCHGEIAADYGRHPMGRSLTTADRAAERERGGDRAATSFDAQGLRYAVERRGDTLIHSEQRLDAQGAVVARAEAEVRYVLGSGERGLSYLIERDGHLFQSPIGWFAQQARWDLSPGYRTHNQHFGRPIEPDCLYCHANRFEPVAGTLNGYRSPIFRGLSIGCERCHGPGGLHVRNPGPAGDRTIVNPRHLEPSRREAVCEQCHLQGVFHVERAGRRATDFRPGLPLESFLAIYVPASPRDGKIEAVGHVEQMHASRCYRASGGRLGCVSCHDPHRKPEPEEAAAFYRDRCLACHADPGCALPLSRRRARSPDDSCIVCHMPRAPLNDIAHTAATDHRIPRAEGRDPTLPGGSTSDRGSDLPLVLYHSERFDPRERSGRERDLGVALARSGGAIRGPMGVGFSQLALPRLEAAIRDWPDDREAREALATALELQGRPAEALLAAKAVLAGEPGRERSLELAMVVASHLRRRDEALDFGRRLLAVDPWVARYHLSMAQIFSRGDDWRPAGGDWRPAFDACRAALRLDPTNHEARRLLIVGAATMGDLPLARDEFRTYLSFDPPDAEPVRRWLDGVAARSPPAR
jgi:predicted CXXCH cytochrome family protein